MPADEALQFAVGLTDADAESLLAAGSLSLVGRLASASNASFFGSVEQADVTVSCIYKPVAGERPLWDFPDGTLAGRELAARLVSEAGGWHVVPATVLRDGRFGTGMCQRWVDVDPDARRVDVVDDTFDAPGWIAVLEAEDVSGRSVLLVHADDPRLRDMAVFDAVINNADRKGGHVLVERLGEEPAAAGGDDTETGRLWGCDHGVSFHAETKLRTVLWGWAGEPLRPRDVVALRRLLAALDGDLEARLSTWLSSGEIAALHDRVEGLLRSGEMPIPDGSWPAVPWPAF